MGQIAKHVPYLRRFARALSGSRPLGDAFVSETLKALIDGRVGLIEGVGRLPLYRAFFQIWQRLDLHDTLIGGSDEMGVDRRLQALVPISRLVFLLARMEGFEPSDIAVICDRRPEEIERLLLEAERALDAQLRTRVLIIEDEWLIASDLTRIVEECGHQVVGIAARRDTAVAQAKILKPGLILADVQLDETVGGIRAVEEILDFAAVPVVFVTGHSDRLLTGTGLEPTYVVGKPYVEATLKAVISQALFFRSVEEAPRDLNQA